MRLQRILLIVSLSAIAVWAMGQDTLTHVIRRGETIEYIAQAYGITIDELSASNNDMDQFYTGLTIRIPPKKADTSITMASVPTPRTKSNVRHAGHGGRYYTAPTVNTATGFNMFSFPAFVPAPNFNPFMAPAMTFTAPAATFSMGSSSVGTTSSSSGSERSCRVCYGSGKCRTCNGNMTYWDSLNGNRKKCPNCSNGLCTSCGGFGKK